MEEYKSIKEKTLPVKESKKYYGPIFHKGKDGKTTLYKNINLEYTLTSFLMDLEARLVNEKILKPWETLGIIEKL